MARPRSSASCRTASVSGSRKLARAAPYRASGPLRGLGLERLTQPQIVDVVLARRMGRLLLDAAFGATQLSAGSDGTQQDRRIR